MQNDLKTNEWTLITGGAKGLGAELCLYLASRGHNILIHYNKSHTEALRIASECKDLRVNAEIIQGDFSSIDKIHEFTSRLKLHHSPIANLVNNVGNYIVESILETTIEQWSDLFHTNLHAPIALINALLPSIKNSKGAIVNLGVVGINHIPADLYATAYTASKLSLLLATKSYAKALVKDGVRVNMVSPGMLENSIDRPSNNSILPMGRPGTLREVARLVSFLLDKENSYITGQNIEIAGALRL
ncbi:MAG: SDR family oxidoreductase [Parachlamydiaceae bacterium]|nr:SDR family oxidoreductase [Parachlamydiaceae bacterium]